MSLGGGEQDSAISSDGNSEFNPVPFRVSLIAGGIAGTAVDVILFPLDTVKTRLQSPQGFLKSGGFRGIYSGIASAATGSAPAAAIFFVFYELVKNTLSPKVQTQYQPAVNMAAAMAGEATCLVVRVPVEVVKQRAQAYKNTTSLQALNYTIKQEGFPGLYRGFANTFWREMPFALLQYPLWEFFKDMWSTNQGRRVDPWQSSVCGAMAGGIAAVVTTPLDVAKTRVMLAEKGCPTTQVGVIRVMWIIRSRDGTRALFAGVVPRVAWITLGGAVFLGFYDKAKNVLMTTERNR